MYATIGFPVGVSRLDGAASAACFSHVNGMTCNCTLLGRNLHSFLGETRQGEAVQGQGDRLPYDR